jgi:hypothetical protein
MKKEASYTILHKGEVLYKNLTEEEYFDIMENLSIEYYQKGSPRPQDLETKMFSI